MAVPHKLHQFTCFVNGDNCIGKVTSVTLPKLTRRTEDFQAAGMMGAVAVDLGLDSGALDTTVVAGGLVRSLLMNYCGGIDETRFRFVGAYYSDSESLLVQIELRGRITEMDGGESKQGEDTSVTYAMKNTWYRLTIDDKPLLEFDLLNFTYKKDGRNIYPDRITSALGMGN